MSESRSGTTPADVQREVDQVADQLYALRPDAFAAARDDRVREARAEGRQPLARELSRLRRPTQSAWLINLLWRDQREVMEQLFELAAELSRAQAQASGAELRSLTAQRRELEGALIRRARMLAEQAGVDVSASMEREAQETLAAALANPEVASEVRTGRLVKPASYAGFGSLPSGAAADVQRPGAPADVQRPSVADKPAATAKVADFQAHAAERARQRREAAERQVQEARASVEAAAGALADQRRAVEAAEKRQANLRQELENLQEQLRHLKDELAAAEETARVAARRRTEAETAHAAAAKTLEDAEQALKNVQ